MKGEFSNVVALHFGGRFRLSLAGRSGSALPPLPQTNGYVLSTTLYCPRYPLGGAGSIARDVVAIIANPPGVPRWTGRNWVRVHEGRVVSARVSAWARQRSAPTLESRVDELERIVGGLG